MALLDLTGQKYGKLTVLYSTGERTKSGHNAIWMCLCDCGRYTKADTGHLRCGDKKSCGCAAVDHARNLNRIHDGKHDRLYSVWIDMRRRCRDPRDRNYKNYGGRGISVCNEWEADYSVFREWAVSAGYDELADRGISTLDRIDVNGNYEPANCRWVDSKTQCNNKRNNVFLTYDGKTMTAAEWSKYLGFRHNLVWKRLNAGWSVERALTEKPRVIKQNAPIT